MSNQMIRVQILGLDRLRVALQGLGPELRLELRKQVSAAAAIVRNEAAARIHSPRGHARKGIKIRVSGAGVDMKARVGPGNIAAVFAQISRAPNTTPPPMKAARIMARRYGIPISKARGIAVMIGRRGTTGHPVMRESLAAVANRVRDAFTSGLLKVAHAAMQR